MRDRSHWSSAHRVSLCYSSFVCVWNFYMKKVKKQIARIRHYSYDLKKNTCRDTSLLVKLKTKTSWPRPARSSLHLPCQCFWPHLLPSITPILEALPCNPPAPGSFSFYFPKEVLLWPCWRLLPHHSQGPESRIPPLPTGYFLRTLRPQFKTSLSELPSPRPQFKFNPPHLLYHCAL